MTERKTNTELPDVQSQTSTPPRSEILAGIDRVKALVETPQGVFPATVRIVARVPEGHRGVHMSRLYRTFLGSEGRIALAELPVRIEETAQEQESVHLRFSVAWEALVDRPAPITGSRGLHPYRAEISAEWTPSGTTFRTRAQSVAMMACPCSKALSGELGFHNQRGVLQAEIDGLLPLALPRLLERIDQAASNRVHPVLRREDEKEVIDRLARDDTYRFVEDAAHHLLDGLAAEGFTGVSLHVRSQESIHAHDAVAWAGPRGEALSEGIAL